MALLTIQFYHAIRFTCGENKGGNLKLKNRYSLITTIILRHTERVFCYTAIISKVIWTNVSDFQFHELAISAIRGDCLKFIARPRGICVNGAQIMKEKFVIKRRARSLPEIIMSPLSVVQ